MRDHLGFRHCFLSKEKASLPLSKGHGYELSCIDPGLFRRNPVTLKYASYGFDLMTLKLDASNLSQAIKRRPFSVNQANDADRLRSKELLLHCCHVNNKRRSKISVEIGKNRPDLVARKLKTRLEKCHLVWVVVVQSAIGHFCLVRNVTK